MVSYRKKEGCSVVEMECAAFAACAIFCKAVWGEILFTADTLAEPENYRERSWGKKAAEQIIDICVDAVMRI